MYRQIMALQGEGNTIVCILKMFSSLPIATYTGCGNLIGCFWSIIPTERKSVAQSLVVSSKWLWKSGYKYIIG